MEIGCGALVSPAGEATFRKVPSSSSAKSTGGAPRGVNGLLLAATGAIGGLGRVKVSLFEDGADGVADAITPAGGMDAREDEDGAKLLTEAIIGVGVKAEVED